MKSTFSSYKEPIIILNLNSLFFQSDFPKSGWDAWWGDSSLSVWQMAKILIIITGKKIIILELIAWYIYNMVVWIIVKFNLRQGLTNVKNVASWKNCQACVWLSRPAVTFWLTGYFPQLSKTWHRGLWCFILSFGLLQFCFVSFTKWFSLISY